MTRRTSLELTDERERRLERARRRRRRVRRAADERRDRRRTSAFARERAEHPERSRRGRPRDDSTGGEHLRARVAVPDECRELMSVSVEKRLLKTGSRTQFLSVVRVKTVFRRVALNDRLTAVRSSNNV